MRWFTPVFFTLLLATAGCSLLAQEPQEQASFGSVDVWADVIESRPFTTQDFEASGDVRATYDGSELFADSLQGNGRTLEFFARRARARVDSLRLLGEEISTRRVAIPGTPTGFAPEYVIKNGLFTTCDLDHPDFKVTAREITLRPDHSAVAKKVSLWLGGVKLITLPKLKMGLGPHARRETFLPTPGFGERDGAYVAFNHRLVASETTDLALRVRATTRQGLQGGVTAERAVSGLLRSNAAAAVELGLRPLLLPAFEAPTETCPVFPQPSALQGQTVFRASLLHNQRTFDIDRKNLRLSAAPQIGVRWISNPVRVFPDSSISAYGAAEASYGRFREEDVSVVTGPRADLRVALSILPIRIPGQLFLQPAVSYRESHYEGPDRYRTVGTSLDITRVFGRSYVSARALNFSVHGASPFEFDDVDRDRELQAAYQYCGTDQGFRLVLRYGFQPTGLYDWEVSYSRKLHCIVPTFTWRNRFGMFGIDVRVLGLN